MMDDFALAHREVERLHDFLSAWFRGDLEKDSFEESFARVLHADFENVQPAGVILSRTDILTAIQRGHGANSNFYIKIEQPRLLGAWPGLILFQYVETQTGAQASAFENQRLSTALFEKVDHQLIWRYLTEVGLVE